MAYRRGRVALLVFGTVGGGGKYSDADPFESASDVLPTQAEAITRAKELSNGGAPIVERVRNTAGGKPDQWRKA